MRSCEAASSGGYLAVSRRIWELVYVSSDFLSSNVISSSGNDNDDAEDIEVPTEVLLFRKPSAVRSIGSKMGVFGSVLLEDESASGESSSSSSPG